MGVVYVPVTAELYVGAGSKGAKKLTLPPTSVVSNETLETGVDLPVSLDRPFTAVGSRSHMNEETENFLKQYREKHGEVAILSKGSSLKMCMVAEGLADVYPTFCANHGVGYRCGSSSS